jgi:hypothetical protein
MNFPAVNTLTGGWSETQHKTSGEFKYKDVSTSLSGYYFPSRDVMWFGPPLIPLFPVFLLNPKGGFGQVMLWVRIESPTETSGLDTSQIQVYGAGGKPLRVDAKSIDFRHASDERERLKQIPKHPTISKGSLSLHLTCYSILSELERFTVDLGSLNVGGESVRLPPLRFRRRTEYKYGPFVFSNHLSDPYFRSLDEVFSYGYGDR